MIKHKYLIFNLAGTKLIDGKRKYSKRKKSFYGATDTSTKEALNTLAKNAAMRLINTNIHAMR